MINAIQDAANAMVKAATDQQQQLLAELSAALDAKEAAQAAFSTAMEGIARIRADADKRFAEAVRANETAMTNLSSVIIALMNQISDGQIVTGAPARKMKAIQGGKGAA